MKDEEKTIKERALIFCEYKHILPTTFEKMAGLGKGHLNKMKRKIFDPTRRGIESAFPDLNIDWLLTGEGDMIKNIIIKDNAKAIVHSDNSKIECSEEILELLKKRDEQIDRLLAIIEDFRNGSDSSRG